MFFLRCASVCIAHAQSYSCSLSISYSLRKHSQLMVFITSCSCVNEQDFFIHQTEMSTCFDILYPHSLKQNLSHFMICADIPVLTYFTCFYILYSIKYSARNCELDRKCDDRILVIGNRVTVKTAVIFP